MISRLLDGLAPTKIPPAPAMSSVAERSVLLDRGLAAAIDLALCYFVVEAPLLYAFDEVAPGGLASLGGTAPALSVLLLAPLYVTYSFAFEWLYARTPGKVNRGLVVVGEDGAPCTLQAAAVRNLLRYVDLVGVPPLVVGLASALLTGGRRVGDHVADTVVVRARPSEEDALVGDDAGRRSTTADAAGGE